MRMAFRTARFVLGILNTAAIAALFLTPPDPVEPWATPWRWWPWNAWECWPWIARTQFVPAVLSLDLIALGALAVATFFFGRIYCEALCPLGVAQDVVRKAALAKRLSVRRVCVNLPVSGANWCVRAAVLVAFVAAGLCGYGYWLDPYAIFCRALCGVELFLAAAVLALSLAGKGRFWCNWVCPAGTVLAAVAKCAPGKCRKYDRSCAHCRACFPAKPAEAGGKGGGKEAKEDAQ